VDDIQFIIGKASAQDELLYTIDALLADGTITGGMIPKVETCVNALKGGVKQAHILDGRIPHVLLIETFTEHGASTMIKA
jgi:acetylglutamate kinase